MAKRPAILILWAPTGTGHWFAARALENAFRTQAPEADIEVRNILALAHKWFYRFYSGGYPLLVRRFPWLMRWLHDTMNRPGTPPSHRFRVRLQNLAMSAAVGYIRRRSPDLIVNSHYLPAEIVAQMRRAGRIDCPQVTITTDYDTHRIWVHEPTERYYTATEDGRANLTTWNIEPERILVTGIPVRPEFETPLDREDARARCGLEQNRPVVLLLCGGLSVAQSLELFDQLTTCDADAQIVAIAGRNDQARESLARSPRPGHGRPLVLGFTDRIHEWMRAADLLVTKPGGLTVAESLVCSLPMVVVHPVPGHEERNSDYLLEQGAAIKLNNPSLLGYRVGHLLNEPGRLAAMRAAARASARPGAAERIARDALTVLAANQSLTNRG